MDKHVLEMFSKSTYAISDQKYIYAKVKNISSLSDHFFVSQDKDEITVVTEEKNLNSLDLIEKNENLWRLVSLNLHTPYMAGTFAEINTACAKNGLNNLIISTYSKDYLIVKDSQVSQIEAVLNELGFEK